MMQGVQGMFSKDSKYGATNSGSPGTSGMNEEQTKIMANAAGDMIKAEGSKIRDYLTTLKDGPLSIRICSFVGGLLLVVSGFMSVLGDFFTLNAVGMLVQVYLFLFGWVIVFVEARNNVLPAKVLAWITEYAKFLTLVWGRGGFFIFCGTLSLSQMNLLDIFLGLYLMGLGGAMIYFGKQASTKLSSIRGSMSDESVLRAKFSAADVNKDGALDSKELATLAESLGSTLSHAELESAIIILDKNRNGVIEYEEFKSWYTGRSGDAAGDLGV